MRQNDFINPAMEKKMLEGIMYGLRQQMIDQAVKRFPFMLRRVTATFLQGCGITLHPGEIDAIRAEFHRIRREKYHAAA